MAEYVGQGVVHLDLRPKRGAYLFRSGSRAEFCAAVSRASTRWGGLQEPIVPVSPAGRIQPAWQQVVQVLAPDVLFDVSGLSDSHRSEIAQRFDADVLPVEMEDRPWYGAHPTVVDQPPATVLGAAGRAVGHLAGAGSGAIDVAGWREAGVNLKPSADGADLAVAQLELRTVIEATTAHCSDVYAADMHLGVGIVWVASPTSLRDALWFWNIRALMPRGVAPARAVLVSPDEAQTRRVMEAIQNAFRTPQKWTTPDVVVVSLTLNQADLKQLTRAWNLREETSRKLSSHYGRERNPRDALTAWFNADPRGWLLGDREPGRRSTMVAVISKPQTMIVATSAVPFGIAGGHVKARLSGLPFLDVPRRKRIAELLIPNGTWKNGGLEVETDPLLTYQFNVCVPDNIEVLAAALVEVGVQAEPSQPGRLADAVRNFVGESRSPLFSNAILRRAIQALTTPRSKTLATEVAAVASRLERATAEAIAERLGQGLSRTMGDAAKVASIAGCSMGEATDALEQLTEVGLAERGLAIACATCGLVSFVPNSITTNDAICLACGARGSYQRAQNRQVAIHYRLNALLDRASDQGVLCHLAIAEQLGGDRSSFLILGANIRKSGAYVGEVDLLGFQSSLLLSGEMKASATGFTRGELRQAVSLAKTVGADVVVFGCTERLNEPLKKEMLAVALRAGLKTWMVDPGGRSTEVIDPRQPSAPMA